MYINTFIYASDYDFVHMFDLLKWKTYPVIIYVCIYIYQAAAGLISYEHDNMNAIEIIFSMNDWFCMYILLVEYWFMFICSLCLFYFKFLKNISFGFWVMRKYFLMTLFWHLNTHRIGNDIINVWKW